MNSESSPRPQPQPFCYHHQQRAVRALRQILRPAVLRDILAGAPGKRATRALRQARRLEPGQTAIAMECHQALIRELRADLRFHGWVNPEWSAVLWHLTLYLEQAGWELVE